MANAKPKSVLEKILAIKALLFDNALPTTYQLADGTEVSISLLDVGGDFSIGGVPAPAGAYSLQDGTNVMVDSTGKITSVTAPEAMAATEYTLADGTKVSIDKMEAGGKVMQGTAPIANGEYTLADGSKITTVDGAITVVTPKPVEAPAAAEKMTKEQIQQAYDDIATAPAGDQMGKIVSCVKALMDYCFGWQIDNAPTPQDAVTDAQNVADAIAAYVTLQGQFTTQNSEVVKLRKELADQKELSTKMLQLMTELAEAPSGDPPPSERKIIFSGDKPKGKKDALTRYAEAAAKMAEENKN